MYRELTTPNGSPHVGRKRGTISIEVIVIGTVLGIGLVAGSATLAGALSAMRQAQAASIGQPPPPFIQAPSDRE